VNEGQKAKKQHLAPDMMTFSIKLLKKLGGAK